MDGRRAVSVGLCVVCTTPCRERTKVDSYNFFLCAFSLLPTPFSILPSSFFLLPLLPQLLIQDWVLSVNGEDVSKKTKNEVNRLIAIEWLTIERRNYNLCPLSLKMSRGNLFTLGHTSTPITPFLHVRTCEE